MKTKVVTLVSVLFLLLFGYCKKENRPAVPPNFILITVDALRADHMGCYGYSYDTSPFIDAFAEKASLFEFAYCPIPKTSASFASMMTGLHPLVHGTKPTRDVLNEKFITLAEAVRMKGYYNVGIVDNGNLSKSYRFNQGFHEYIEVWTQIERFKDSTKFITDKVIHFLEQKKKEPFFLWAHYIETHTPYDPPEAYIEERPPGRDINQLEKKAVTGTKHERELLKTISHEGHFISLYDGCVKYVDEEIGKIIQHIFANGYDENSIVIISSDHGEDLGEKNLFFNHGPLAFNAGARVPLLVYIPGEKGKKIKYPVSLMDIYPTVLKTVGLFAPYSLQGQDLFTRTEDRFINITAVAQDFLSYSVVYDQYHFVRVPPKLARRLGLKTEFLFDIEKDPTEKDSILGKKMSEAQLMEKQYRQFFNKQARKMKKKGKAVELPEKDLENLRALGYIK